MGRLRPALVALFLLWPVQAPAKPVYRWASQIAEASRRFGIPEEWIRRVMRAESGGRTMIGGRPIVSRAGAMGLMQVMPGTWREMRSAHGLGADPHDPRDNILAGTAYLRAMHDRFGYPGLFAAYNAGPARYSEHLARGRRLPSETVEYVAAVAGRAEPPAPPAAGRAAFHQASLFAVVAAAPPGVSTVAAPLADSAETLFVRLNASEPR